MQATMIGDYGEWAAGLVGDGPAKLSFRRDEFVDVEDWRRRARQRVIERLAPPALQTPTDVELVESGRHDGLDVELLRWDVGYGRATEAVLLKPTGQKGPLPGVLALHDHAGKKYFGRQKVARWAQRHPLMVEHHEQYYGGRAWANELARRGYVVLVHDAFTFASRRVRSVECAEPVRGISAEPTDDDHDSIAAYNRWAAGHEHIMAKSLFCAGTTWPGVFWQEDRVALDILASRDDVDAKRLGCGGLSGGGLRTCFLAGLDERIGCAVCAGFMSTWRDFLLRKVHTHTWMMYVPLLPAELNFPEILGLRAPAPTMVMHCTEDRLFSNEAVRDSAVMLGAIFAKAGGANNLRFEYYPGGHKFDVTMQREAFDFFDRHLGCGD